MQELKFRYIFKHETGNKIIEVYTLEQIEKGINVVSRHSKILIAKDQYTGLKDKKEVEIYENDIVKYSFYGIAIIKFGGGTNRYGSDSSAYFYGYYLEFRDKKDCWNNYEVDSACLYDELKEIEVIGNIYSNLELLKEKENS